MQIIEDELEGYFPEIRFYKGEDANIPEGISFYHGQSRLESPYVYIVRSHDLASVHPEREHCSLVVLGKIPEEWIAVGHSI
ncbi:MAG: hypothetical protein ACI35P_03935, partial [Bacillus sp. (in: firmicutes)]